MIKQLIIFFFILLIASSSFALDKKIEKALVANDWQQVYDLLEKNSKNDPIHNFLRVQACIAIDCGVDVIHPNFDEKSFEKLSQWINNFSSTHQYNIVAKQMLSELHLLNGNFQKAIQYSIEITKGDSSFILAYNTRSNAFIAQGKFEYALNALNQLLKQDTSHSLAYLNRGVIYDEMHDYKNALINYKKSIELSSNNSMVYYNLGNTHRHLGNDSLAIINYSKTLAIDNKHMAAYYNRGNTYFDTKSFENSKKDYQMFLQLVPQEMYQIINTVNTKIEYIDNYDKNFDKDKIEQTITNAYNAWMSQDWLELGSFIHSDALDRFKSINLPTYQSIDTTNGQLFLFGKIVYNIKNIINYPPQKFFEFQMKQLTGEVSKIKDMFTIQNIEILDILPDGPNVAIAKLKVEYATGATAIEKLEMIFVDSKWKLWYPEPIVKILIATSEES